MSQQYHIRDQYEWNEQLLHSITFNFITALKNALLARRQSRL
jgi:hypothetical protein